MKRRTLPRYLLCIKTGGYPESLEVRKLYRVLPDALAAKAEQVRVIDESGEDYLYPNTLFAPVRLTPPVRKLLIFTDCADRQLAIGNCPR